jgi:hypothetical protein
LGFAADLIPALTLDLPPDPVFGFNFGFAFDFLAMTHILSLIEETPPPLSLKIGLRHAQTN